MVMDSSGQLIAKIRYPRMTEYSNAIDCGNQAVCFLMQV